MNSIPGSATTHDRKATLSTWWIVVVLNMVFADIFSIIIELVDKNTLEIPGDVKVTMAIAALITNIPILMIYLSRVLPRPSNRLCNIIAGVLTIIYVIAGGGTSPHYLIIAAIEIIFLILIIVHSWKWSNSKN